jgi:hypothetical protein
MDLLADPSTSFCRPHSVHDFPSLFPGKGDLETEAGHLLIVVDPFSGCVSERRDTAGIGTRANRAIQLLMSTLLGLNPESRPCKLGPL